MARRKAKAGDPKSAVGYLRVSTEDQKLGPEAQRAAIEAWAHRESATVVAWYTDQGISGGAELDDRPGLAGALEALRVHRAGVLVVAKRDRIARDVVIAAMIERAAGRAGARVVAADGVGNGDGPAEQFMRTMIDGAAAYERALIRQRTRAALAVKKAAGQRVGNIPFGYRLGGDGIHLEPDEAEQVIVGRVLELRGAGVPFQQIVHLLDVAGVRSRKGRPMGLGQVYAIAQTRPSCVTSRCMTNAIECPTK